MNLIDKAFGTHPQAITLLSQRSSVLSSNIANASSADYKARDFDFRSMLQTEQLNQKVRLDTTRAGHIGESSTGQSSDLLYRVPTKNVSNGNTVEAEVEQTAFAENAMRYQSSLTFLSGTISGLKLAIKGTR